MGSKLATLVGIKKDNTKLEDSILNYHPASLPA